ISYYGPDAQDAHWVQFLWVEHIVKDVGGRERHLTGVRNLDHDSRLRDFNLSDKEPKEAGQYQTDAFDDGDSPFYEARGCNSRSAFHTTIYDSPGHSFEAVDRAININDYQSFTEIIHAEAFLVLRDQVVYQVQLQRIDTYIGVYGGDGFK